MVLAKDAHTQTHARARAHTHAHKHIRDMWLFVCVCVNVCGCVCEHHLHRFVDLFKAVPGDKSVADHSQVQGVSDAATRRWYLTARFGLSLSLSLSLSLLDSRSRSRACARSVSRSF